MLQYVADLGTIWSQEELLLPMVNKTSLIKRGLLYQRQYDIINLKEVLYMRVCYYSFIGQQ